MSESSYVCFVLCTFQHILDLKTKFVNCTWSFVMSTSRDWVSPLTQGCQAVRVYVPGKRILQNSPRPELVTFFPAQPPS